MIFWFFLVCYWKNHWYIYIIILDFIYVSNLMKFSTKRWLFTHSSWLTSFKKGFTLREILIIIVVISVGLLSVIVVLTDGMKYVQKTRQRVIALNLAREWMEAVYQIRDTNWMKWTWFKDSCWLKNNPLFDEWFDGDCTNDSWFTSGFYSLQRLSAHEQEYFTLTGPFLSWLNLSDGTIDTGDLKFSLCQQSWYWDSCTEDVATTSEWKYFRQIQWIWLYLKDVPVTWWTVLLCTWWMMNDCSTSRAKEFRFCSKVAYIGNGTGEVQLCWVMTNFK